MNITREQFLNQKIHKDATVTVVFFHGLLCNCYSNPPIEEVCDSLKMDFICYTFPFHKDNKSVKKSEFLFNHEMYEIYKFLMSKIKTKKIIIIGHSAGAVWSAIFYESAKDKFSVEKFIFICPIISSTRLLTFNKFRVLKKYYDVGRTKEISRSLWNFSTTSNLFSDNNLLEIFAWLGFFSKLKSKKIINRTEEIYKNMKCEKMVIGGELDMVLDNEKTKEIFTKLSPGSKYITLKATTHVPHRDNYELYIDVMTKILSSNHKCIIKK
ncbi:MAG: hypothetical protein ACRC42_00520 [Mycoplasma sp.]